MNESKLEEKQIKVLSVIYSYLEEGMKGMDGGIAIIKKTFLLMLGDFFDNKLKRKPDIYTLEEFAGHMLFVVYTPEMIKKKDPELAKALDIASDLTFYFKKGQKNKDLDEFNKLIGYLKNYFKSGNVDLYQT